MITELERLLAHYGCDRFCYNNNGNYIPVDPEVNKKSSFS